MNNDQRLDAALIVVLVVTACAVLFGQVLVQAWPPQDPVSLVYGLFTATVGPFVGAGLAFIAARRHEDRKLEREHLAAGRHAMLIASAWMNDFVVFRRSTLKHLGALEKEKPDRPAWSYAYSMDYPFDKDLRIDFASLAFLFEESDTYTEMHGRVRQAERAYNNLFRRVEQVTAVAMEMQRKISDFVTSRGAPGDFDEARVLGPEIVIRAQDLVRALAAELDASAEADYVTAMTLLRTALAERYPNATFPRYCGVPEGARLADLPPLPRALRPVP